MSGKASTEPARLDGALTGITYRKGAFLIGEFTGEKGTRARVLGELESVSLGQPLTLYGEWTVHPKFGRQFRVQSFHCRVPVSEEGIRRYLGSGLIKGIGPKLSEAIVSVFGGDTIKVLDEEPKRLREVAGVGPSRVELILEGWTRHRKVMDIMVFLQGHQISASLSAKIYRRYHEESIAVLKKNPYLLTDDLKGVGFKTADKIAGGLGIARDSAFRIRAGIRFALSRALEEGHCCLPGEDIPEKVAELLEVPADLVSPELEHLVLEKELFRNDEDTYLSNVFAAEQGAADSIARLLKHPPHTPAVDYECLLETLERNKSFVLNQEQRAAGVTALEKSMLVITGGPGTGKTTLISFLVHLIESARLSVCLTAPTGRAAKRMEEVCLRPAKTIHRLLEFMPREGRFRRGREFPLEYDAVIVDESSMIDIFLFNRLLAALDNGSRLIMVGDHNQLPSVGPGNVLADIIRSNRVPVVHLSEIYRQAGSGYIVLNAHRINQGLLPKSGKKMNGSSSSTAERGEQNNIVDFYFVREDDSEKAEKLVVDLAARRLPGFLNIDAVNDLQVLSPMYRGPCGVDSLNAELQIRLNPHGREQLQGGSLFRVGDKVMQIRNDYQKDVFNGDLGRISRIENQNRSVDVIIGGRTVSYDFDELGDLLLAYAITVHKSQGSEYQAVVLPLVNHHFIMLQRNLLYTAVTRARRMMVIVGSRKALAIAVKNATVRDRRTGLVKNLKLLLEKN